MAKQAPGSGPLAPDAVYTRGEIADWLKIRPRQLERYGIPSIDLGHRTKRYLGSEVLAWLDALRSTLVHH